MPSDEVRGVDGWRRPSVAADQESGQRPETLRAGIPETAHARLICGSLVYDTITSFPVRFAQQLAPLDSEPVVMAAAGPDAQDDLPRIRGRGATPDSIRVVGDSQTAQAIIITDQDNNQITAFHPGAMQHAHLTAVPTDRGIAVAIVVL